MKNSTQRGFTLIEVTIVLMVLAILASVMVPSIGGFNSLARTVRVSEDLGAICSVMKMMLDDMRDSAFFGAYGSTRYVSSGYGIASGGGSSYGYGSGGTTMTEQSYTVSVPLPEQACQPVRSDYSDAEWCDNCNMPRSECGDHCMDDCDETCTHPSHMPVAPVTTMSTITSSYGGGNAAGGGYTTRTSSGSTVSAVGGYGWGAGHPIGLLAGDGDIPASAIGATPWQFGLGTTFVETTDVNYRVAMNFLVDSLSDVLIHEDPTFAGYGTAGAIGFNNGLETRPGWPPARWRGPYMADTIASDPWGNRYMANVFALHVPPSGSYAWTPGGRRYQPEFTSATVCLSAGPNETVETFFNQPRGWYTGGDDRTVVLAGAGGIR